MNLNLYEEKLKNYIAENKIEAEHIVFEESCHSVEDAAIATNSNVEDLIKNICMVDKAGNLIVGIIMGEDKVSVSKVAKALDITTPKIAKMDQVLAKTGFPCGGIPSFGYDAIFIIDPKVMELEYTFSGGGSPNSLVKIRIEELKRVNCGTVIDIVK